MARDLILSFAIVRMTHLGLETVMPPGCVDRRQMTRASGIEPYRNKGRKATSEIVTAVDSVVASKSSGYGLAEEEDDDIDYS